MQKEKKGKRTKMKFLSLFFLLMIALCSLNAWDDHPDRDNERDLLSQEDSLSRIDPHSFFSVDPDRGCDEHCWHEPDRGTSGPPDRDK